jgi:hypothetical protein
VDEERILDIGVGQSYDSYSFDNGDGNERNGATSRVPEIEFASSNSRHKRCKTAVSEQQARIASGGSQVSINGASQST